MSKQKILDVRDLPAPEPLQAILAASEDLPAGDYLHALHRQDPHLLAGALEGSDLALRVVRGRDGGVHIFIWHQADTETAARVNRAAQDLA